MLQLKKRSLNNSEATYTTPAICAGVFLCPYVVSPGSSEGDPGGRYYFEVVLSQG